MKKWLLVVLLLLAGGCKSDGSGSLLKGIGPFADTMTMLKSRFPEQTQQKHTYCRLCHEIPSKGTFKAYVETVTNRTNPFTGKPYERIEAICTSCHTSTHMAHPVGIIPDPRKVVLPPEARGFRGEENKLTCLGCHNQHPDNQNYKYLRWSADGGEDKAKFCVKCHPKQGRQDMQRLMVDSDSMNWRGVMLPSKSRPSFPAAGYYYRPRQEALGKDYRVSERFKANLAEKSYQLGMGLLERGEIEKALTALGKAVEQNPKHAEAYFEIGKVLALRGQNELAVENFRRATDASPSYKEAYYELGGVYLAQKNYPKAIANYEKAVAVDPAFAAGYYGLGNAYLAQGLTEKALYLYDQALQADAGFAEAYYGMGEAYLAMGKPGEALRMYNKAVESRSTYYQAYYRLGEAYARQRDWEEAQAAYRKAIKLRYNYAAAYYGLAKTYRATGKNKDAVHTFERAMQMDPSYVAALYEIAEISCDEKMWDKAIDAYREITREFPDDARGYQGMGEVYLKARRRDEALACFEKVLQLNPRHGEAGLQLGKVYFSDRKWDQARRFLEVAVRSREVYPEAAYYLGRVYQEEDELDEAVAWFEKAIAQDSRFSRAYYNLALVYKSQGRDEEADEAYYRAVKTYLGEQVDDAQVRERLEDPVIRHKILVEIDADSAKNHYNLGMAYVAQGEMEAARESLKTATELDPDYWQAYYYLGLAANALHDYQQAVKAYLRLLDLRPEEKQTHYYLGIAYKGMADWDKAIFHFKQVLDKKPVQANYCIGQAYYEKWVKAKKESDLQNSLNYLEAALKVNPDHEEAKSNLYVVENLLSGKVEILLISSSRYSVIQDIYYALQGKASRRELKQVLTAYPVKSENLFVAPREFAGILGHELDNLKDGQYSKIIQNKRTYYIICRLNSLLQ